MTSSVDFIDFVMGKVNHPSTAQPFAFDASALVVEAAAKVGVTMPDASNDQHKLCVSKGTMLSIDVAKYIRGALLFEKSSSNYVVGISLGNGEVVESRKGTYAVQGFTDRRWHDAALIPGVTY